MVILFHFLMNLSKDSMFGLLKEKKWKRGVFSALQALVCNEVLTISMGKSAPQESYLEADFVVGIAFPPILCTPMARGKQTFSVLRKISIPLTFPKAKVSTVSLNVITSIIQQDGAGRTPYKLYVFKFVFFLAKAINEWNLFT